MAGKRDHVYDKTARCPFYRGTRGRNTILCEGPFDGSYIGMNITNKDLFACQVGNYCGGDYAKCEIYRMVAEKYKD